MVVDEPLRPEEVEELPERPLEVLLEFRSVLEDDPIPDVEELFRSVVEEAPMPPEVEELLRSVDDDEPMPLLVLSAVEEEDEPIPPLVEDEPERPPLEVPLVSERRLLLPRLGVLPLELLDEFTGQLLMRAGFETSPCTIVRSLN